MCVVDLLFTLAETAQVVDPPMTETQLRLLVRALGWRPAGYRRDGRPGHPVAEYDAVVLLDLHRVLTPFLRAET